jgi:hypothetical protein
MPCAARALLNPPLRSRSCAPLSHSGTDAPEPREGGEPIFMKHAASRELYAYWEERRGRRAAPERAEIEPGAIRGALSDAFILSLDAARGHPVRLAGTRVCALFGRELRGEPFLRLWAADSRTIIAGLLAILGDERIGTVAARPGGTAPAMSSISNSCCCRSTRHGRVSPVPSVCWRRSELRHGLARARSVRSRSAAAATSARPSKNACSRVSWRRGAAVVSLSTMAAVPSGSFAGATSVGVNAG